MGLRTPALFYHTEISAISLVRISVRCIVLVELAGNSLVRGLDGRLSDGSIQFELDPSRQSGGLAACEN